MPVRFLTKENLTNKPWEKKLADFTLQSQTEKKNTFSHERKKQIKNRRI
jgi:hypothetical protein